MAGFCFRISHNQEKLEFCCCNGGIETMMIKTSDRIIHGIMTIFYRIREILNLYKLSLTHNDKSAPIGKETQYRLVG